MIPEINLTMNIREEILGELKISHATPAMLGTAIAQLEIFKQRLLFDYGKAVNYNEH